MPCFASSDEEAHARNPAEMNCPMKLRRRPQTSRGRSAGTVPNTIGTTWSKTSRRNSQHQSITTPAIASHKTLGREPLETSSWFAVSFGLREVRKPSHSNLYRNCECPIDVPRERRNAHDGLNDLRFLFSRRPRVRHRKATLHALLPLGLPGSKTCHKPKKRVRPNGVVPRFCRVDR